MNVKSRFLEMRKNSENSRGSSQQNNNSSSVTSSQGGQLSGMKFSSLKDLLRINRITQQVSTNRSDSAPQKINLEVQIAINQEQISSGQDNQILTPKPKPKDKFLNVVKKLEQLSTQDCSPHDSFISPTRLGFSDEKLYDMGNSKQHSSIMMQRWINHNIRELQPLDFNDTTQYLLKPFPLRKNQQQPEYAF